MSDHQLHVYSLPQDVDELDLVGSTVIVIDLLRATSTICQALASGASEVVPFRTIEETLAAAQKAGRDRVVLGGERDGRRIDGFDLGNSPSEYTPASVGGRCVYITTTNGTRALYHARLAKRVVVGAIVNLAAVVASIQDEPRIDVLCAGTNGQETREDILAAGAIVHLCAYLPETYHFRLSDGAAFAGAQWSAVLTKARFAGREVVEHLGLELRDTLGGRNCIESGNADDLADCAQIDRLTVVPELDVRNWRITSR